MKPEADASVYDGKYESFASAVQPIQKSFYYPLFKRVVKTALTYQPKAVLEVGCGAGGVAQLLREALPAVRYRGFDFSKVAIGKARARLGSDDLVFEGNALDPAIYAREPHDLILCTEVLEHVERDTDVVALWNPGVRVVCTVPNFDADTHVRLFRSEAEVEARYGGLIAIDRIERFAKPVGAGMSAAQWLRQCVWMRSDPRKLAGHLGINRFEWSAGWFLFSGTRR